MNGRESASEVFDGLTLWPDGESQPLISTLNAIDGAITSNMAIVPNLNGSIDAFASGITQLILDISSYGAMALLRLAQSPRESGPAKSLTYVRNDCRQFTYQTRTTVIGRFPFETFVRARFVITSVQAK